MLTPAAQDDFEDLAKFGITREQLETAGRTQDEPQICKVWPEHWRAVLIFSAMRTQWRTQVGARMIYLGLDYAALPVVKSHIPPQVDCDPGDPELFSQIRTLELAGIDLLNRD